MPSGLAASRSRSWRVIPGWFAWQADSAALALATSCGVGVKPGVVGTPDGATPPLGAVLVGAEFVTAVWVLWVVVAGTVGPVAVRVMVTVGVLADEVGTVTALVVEVVVALPPPHPARTRAASSAPVRSGLIAR